MVGITCSFWAANPAFKSFSTVVLILGIMVVWGFLHNNIDQNQPHNSDTTVWQFWLGIAKPKNVFRLTLNLEVSKNHWTGILKRTAGLMYFWFCTFLRVGLLYNRVKCDNISAESGDYDTFTA